MQPKNCSGIFHNVIALSYQLPIILASVRRSTHRHKLHKRTSGSARNLRNSLDRGPSRREAGREKRAQKKTSECDLTRRWPKAPRVSESKGQNHSGPRVSGSVWSMNPSQGSLGDAMDGDRATRRCDRATHTLDRCGDRAARCCELPPGKEMASPAMASPVPHRRRP